MLKLIYSKISLSSFLGFVLMFGLCMGRSTNVGQGQSCLHKRRMVSLIVLKVSTSLEQKTTFFSVKISTGYPNECFNKPSIRVIQLAFILRF